MQRIIYVLLLALLAGCGSEGTGSKEENIGGVVKPTEGDLSDLNGLPIQDFIRAIVPRLALEPGLQDPTQLASSLEQKWKIHCEQICRIERK